MSVVKSKRKESKFEVLHHAYKLRKDITNLLLYDFGYKWKENTLESEFRSQRRAAFESWFIENSRTVIITRLRNLIANLIAANGVRPDFTSTILSRLCAESGKEKGEVVLPIW